MERAQNETIKYVLISPSSNVTVLVLDEGIKGNKKELSKKIMAREPSAEQLGFLFVDKVDNIFLQMAGGEFCGNASMSAVVYYAIKKQLKNVKKQINVYGVKKKVNVEVEQISNQVYNGIVEMPAILNIKEVSFFDKKTYSVVFFENIAHIIIEDIELNDIKKEEYEKKIKKYCEQLGLEALGIISYNSDKSKINPLVYVKSIDTLFWENACASGTAAVAAFISEIEKSPIRVSILQPSLERLDVEVDIEKNIYLKGKVKFFYEKSIEVNDM